MSNITEQKSPFILSAIRTIRQELESIEQLIPRIDGQFEKACTLMLGCTGRVVVMGIGKSGHVANKIAATLASTGTPAFFVHPGEASHGDLGMITKDDVIIVLSNSGTTKELISLVPLFKRLGVPLLSMTGNTTSILAQASDVHLDVSVEKEACPLDLAPTSSTTVCLVMGDALAVSLLEARGFSAEDFAFSHPGGALGRKLLLKVSDIMLDGQDIPKVLADEKLSSALTEMTSKGLGMTTVVDSSHELLGIFTDGDLRRCVDKGIDIQCAIVKEVMTASPTTISKNCLAVEALNLMENKKITALVVEDNDKAPVGIIHMHDLLRADIV